MTTKRFIVIAGIVLTALTGAGLTLYSWNEWMLRPASLEIGLVWPETTDLFFDGAKLAVRDVNDAGGLFHQQLTIAVPPQEPGGAAGASTNSVTAGTDTAIVTANALLAAHPDLLAVVGHRDPMEAIPAANVYESNKVLFLSPTGTQSRLTGRTTPSGANCLPATATVAATSVSRYSTTAPRSATRWPTPFPPRRWMPWV